MKDEICHLSFVICHCYSSFRLHPSSFPPHRRSHVAAATSPVRVEVLPTRFVNALVRVRAEIIALRLQEIRRQ
jgi:hypothetical protein